jgi:hypothetical protein
VRGDIRVTATRKHAIEGVVRMESGGREFFVVCARAIVWLRDRYDGSWRLPRQRISPPGCACLSTIRAWQPRHRSIAQHKTASVSFFSNASQSSDIYRSPNRRLPDYLTYLMFDGHSALFLSHVRTYHEWTPDLLQLPHLTLKLLLHSTFD